MQTKLNAYINFRSATRSAMEFYQSVFGGKLSLNTFKDFHAAENPAEENLVMHAQLETDNGMTLMAADSPARMDFHPGNNFSLMLGGDSEAELTGYFDQLSKGGTVTQPLTKAMWGDTFGMVVDQFGVNWMVNISPKS